MKSLKKDLSNKSQCVIIQKNKKEVIKMKKDKRQFKMTPEQLQGLLHMRKRNWVQKNGKAYNRKQKHKNREE